MLEGLKRLDPGQAVGQILFYRLCYWIVLGLFVLLYRARFFNTRSVPRSGGLLIIANHQSHLDPPLLGVAIRDRNMAAIAREGLFKHWPMGLLLRGLGCIAIKEDEGDAGAIRSAIAQLKAGRVVVIFPEGSRSPDGALKHFKRGVWVLLARSGVPILPAAVEGCYDAFPRGAAFPKLFGQRVAVAFGEPIRFAELKALGADGALQMLANRVESLRLNLRAKIRRATHERLPAHGAGDSHYPAGAEDQPPVLSRH